MKAEKEFVQLVGVPPAFHVGLAEPERSLGQDPVVESVVVDLDIPRLRPVHMHLGSFEQPVNNVLWIHRGNRLSWV